MLSRQSYGVSCGRSKGMRSAEARAHVIRTQRGGGRAPTPQFNARDGGACAAMCFLSPREIARLRGLGESQTFLRCCKHAI
jgi:hypothetical protein